LCCRAAAAQSHGSRQANQVLCAPIPII
jgi:hypothetical protein